MVDLTDAEIDAAMKCGEAARQIEPRATEVGYYDRLGQVVVALSNGCRFTFPRHLAQGMETAMAKELAQVEIFGDGYGLR